MIPPQAVVLAAAMTGGLHPAEMIGPRRDRQPARARFAAALVLRWHGWSYPDIGRELGGRDHSTAISAVRTAGADLNLLAMAADVAVRCELERGLP